MALTKFFQIQNLSPVHQHEDWAVKHRPKRIKDILVNKDAVQRLVDWCENRDDHPQLITILGGNGVGKTVLSKVVLEEHGFLIMEKSVGDKRNKQFVTEIMDILQHSPHNTILFIDNIDVSNTEVMQIFLDLMEPKKRKSKHDTSSLLWNIPIVCVSNNMYGSVSSIIEKSYTVYFHPVPWFTLMKVAKQVLSKEKTTTLEDKDIRTIAQKSRGDVRYMIQQLSFYHSTPNAAKITSTRMESKTIFQAVTGILQNEPMSIDKGIHLASIDPNVVTCMIFENYLDYAKDISHAAKACHLMSINDLMSTTHTYEVEPIWTTMSTKAIQPHLLTPKIPPKIRYPCIFSKLSLLKSHDQLLQKVGHSLVQKQRSISSKYHHFLVEIMLNLLHTDCDRFVQLCKEYDLDFSHIEMFPKICNIVKRPLKQKQKTYLKNALA